MVDKPAASSETAGSGAAVADPAVAAAAAPAAAANEAAAAAPSLLASADAGKAEHAKPDAKPAAEGGAEKSTETKPVEAAAAAPGEKPDTAKPADAGKVGEDGQKPDVAKEPATPDAALEGKKPETAADTKTAEKPADTLADKPPVPPTYEAFKLPDNVKVDQVRMDKFSSILGESELSGKVDHKVMQELGQKVIDLYAEESQRISDMVTQHQIDVWNRLKEGWINELKSDPELGGNRIETSLGNAKYAFENFLGLSKDQQAGLLTVMDNAGLSDHPLMVRALHNLYERLAEPLPAQPNLPGSQQGERGPGQRGWYDKAG